jgi:hypothetical protein
MASYSELMSSFDSVFSTTEWTSVGLPAFPANFFPSTYPDEFIRYQVVPSEEGVEEYGRNLYKSGFFIVEIYAQSNKGPKRIYEIASVIEDYFANRSFMKTQVSSGTLQVVGIDKDDTSLFRADYSLKFNSF